MAILKLREREKQTVNRSDKGFLFELREIRVAYGEMCLAVMEMMWMTGELKQGDTPIGHSNDTVHVAGDWDAQKNEAHVMLWSG